MRKDRSLWSRLCRVERELQRVMGVRSFLRDLSYAARVLLKTPVVTGVAVLALALGIGVNAGVFVSVSSLVLHPLPYPNLDRLVTIGESLSKSQTEPSPLAPADFADLAKEDSSFQSLAAYRSWDANLTGAANPEPVEAYQVTPEFFHALGTPARLGRTELSPRQVVVSEGFWKSHLAAAPNVIGRTVFLNRREYTITGVMPDRFDFPLGTAIWSPLILTPAEQHIRDQHDLMAIGLLKPGFSPRQAEGEAAAIASRLERAYPKTNEGCGILLRPFYSLTDQVTEHFLMVVFGAALFVLLLACTNVGNLQLARAANREKEIAVRAAIGASRFQIARELFAECILLSAASTFIGLLLASWNNEYAKRNIPVSVFRIVPGLRTMRVDTSVVLFTTGIAFVAALLCSLPAISQLIYGRRQGNLSDVLHGRGISTTPERNRLRAALIVGQLALALVLLVGAGLMVKTFDRLLAFNQGFDRKNLLTMRVSLPGVDYQQNQQMVSFYDRVLAGFGGMERVQADGLSSPAMSAEHLAIEGQPAPQPGQPRPEISAVSGGYLQAMRIPVLAGRSISGQDRPVSPHVAVISKSLAQAYWPHSSPIGHRIRFDSESGWFTIVGVCGDVIEDWFSGRPTPAAYISFAQFPAPHAMLFLRTKGDPLQAAKAARNVVYEVDKNVPVFDVKSMERRMAEERGGVQAAATSMATYAMIALLLAITGLYAVVSYLVAARTHDIGVRIALGASRADVLSMMMRRTMLLIGTGLAIGIPLSIALARVMASALYNVVSLDPVIFVLFTGLLVISAAAASYLPARRATRIDPMVALRSE